MVLLELFFVWSYQYTLLRILDYATEEIDLGEAERRGMRVVRRKAEVLKEVIASDQARDEEEADRAFRLAVIGRKVDLNVAPLQRENKSAASGLRNGLGASGHSEGRCGVAVQRFNGCPAEINGDVGVSSLIKEGNRGDVGNDRGGKQWTREGRGNVAETEVENTMGVERWSRESDRDLQDGVGGVGISPLRKEGDRRDVGIETGRKGRAEEERDIVDTQRGRGGYEKEHSLSLAVLKRGSKGSRMLPRVSSSCIEHPGLLSSLAAWFSEARSKHKRD